MFKINDLVDKIGADKFIHLLACIIIAENVATYDAEIFNRSAIVAAAIGAITAIIISVCKEVIDFIRKGLFDVNDLKFDCYGAILGGLLALILLII
nr:MAG TPA: putative periplasmic lipoprotein [Crassvirales sp.]